MYFRSRIVECGFGTCDKRFYHFSYGFFFFWKKRRIVCGAFLSKGGHWKKKRRLRRAFFKKRHPEKSAPAVGFIQKDTSRTITTSSNGGPGAEPPEKFWELWHKSLSVFFTFSNGQVRRPINFPFGGLSCFVSCLCRLYNIQKTAIYEARPYLEAQRSWKAGALRR